MNSDTLGCPQGIDSSIGSVIVGVMVARIVVVAYGLWVRESIVIIQCPSNLQQNTAYTETNDNLPTSEDVEEAAI